jgi:hypothetical protein
MKNAASYKVANGIRHSTISCCGYPSGASGTCWTVTLVDVPDRRSTRATGCDWRSIVTLVCRRCVCDGISSIITRRGSACSLRLDWSSMSDNNLRMSDRERSDAVPVLQMEAWPANVTPRVASQTVRELGPVTVLRQSLGAQVVFTSSTGACSCSPVIFPPCGQSKQGA